MPHVKGRIALVGLAEGLIDAVRDGGLRANDRIVLAVVDDDDPGDLPIGLMWAERVKITIDEKA